MIYYVDTIDKLNDAVKLMNDLVGSNVGEEVIIGLDCEWIMNDTKVSVLQLQVLSCTFIIHLSLIGWKMPENLEQFMNRPGFFFTGSNVKGDCTRLFKYNQDSITDSMRVKSGAFRTVDLKLYAKRMRIIPNRFSFTLSRMAKYFFDYDMDKVDVRVSNWRERLSPSQIRYASIDVKMSRDVYFEILKHSSKSNVSETCETYFSQFHSVQEDTWKNAIDMPQHLPNGETNSDWIALRKHRITGSKISACVGLNPYETKEDFLKTMIYGYSGPRNEAPLQHGNKHEDDAERQLVLQLEKDESIESFHIEHPGIVLRRKLGSSFFGYSPDGILHIKYKNKEEEVCLVEYKAPYFKRFVSKDYDKFLYGPITVPFPLLPSGEPNPTFASSESADDLNTIGVTKYYYCQVQYGMKLLQEEGLLKPLEGKNMRCKFVLYTFNLTQMYDVPYDPLFAESYGRF